MLFFSFRRLAFFSCFLLILLSSFTSFLILLACLGVVGLILALQLSPPLDEFGQRPLIAYIIGVAVLRELGPLIGAIVLTGFAGASIAAYVSLVRALAGKGEGFADVGNLAINAGVVAGAVFLLLRDLDTTPSVLYLPEQA